MVFVSADLFSLSPNYFISKCLAGCHGSVSSVQQTGSLVVCSVAALQT